MAFLYVSPGKVTKRKGDVIREKEGDGDGRGRFHGIFSMSVFVFFSISHGTNTEVRQRFRVWAYSGGRMSIQS